LAKIDQRPRPAKLNPMAGRTGAANWPGARRPAPGLHKVAPRPPGSTAALRPGALGPASGPRQLACKQRRRTEGRCGGRGAANAAWASCSESGARAHFDCETRADGAGDGPADPHRARRPPRSPAPAIALRPATGAGVAKPPGARQRPRAPSPRLRRPKAGGALAEGGPRWVGSSSEDQRAFRPLCRRASPAARVRQPATEERGISIEALSRLDGDQRLLRP